MASDQNNLSLQPSTKKKQDGSQKLKSCAMPRAA
jgi:hypothetical protein